MDTKDIIKATESTQKLIHNSDYYKYIFKKTERIVSVVFYITNNIDDKDTYKSQIEDIETAARNLHDVVLQSLQMRAHVAEEAVQATIHAIVVLESKLKVAQVMGLVAIEVLQVLFNESDSVLRGLSKYTNESNVLIEREQAYGLSKRPKQTPKTVVGAPAPTTQSTTAQPAAPIQPIDNRRARIMTVIEAKEEVSIKDITDIITDVSEKTIQRELNAMIEDNLIKRIGQKRWSRYTLF